MPSPPMRELLGFIAAAISVLTFHQGMWAALHSMALPGLTMPPPYPTDPIPPLTPSAIVSTRAGSWPRLTAPPAPVQ
jgi:hypothetical protein